MTEEELKPPYEDQYNVPPIIKNMIANLRNDRTPLHLRNNIKMMLDNIVKACTVEIEYFNSIPTVSQPVKRKKPVSKRR